MQKSLNSSLIFKSGIASIDQAVLSAVNFIVSIILIKNVPKMEYGYYSIAFSILLIFISIQSAIISAPMAVLLTTKKREARKRYVGSLCYGQFIGIVPLAFIAMVVIGLLKLWMIDINAASIAAAVCVAAFGLLFREFFRAYYYAEEAPIKVLKMDMLYTLIFLTIIISMLIFVEIKTSYVFVLTGTCAFVVTLIYSRKLKWEFNKEAIIESYTENWKFGKWALLGVLVTHTQNYSYLYLTGAILGSTAVADLSAARLLLMPLILIEMGWSKIAIPHGSKLREQNKINELFKNQILASLIVTVTITVYITLLIIFFEYMETFLLTKKYSDSRDFFLFFGAIFSVRFITLNASYGLQVMKKFEIISKINFLTMLITVGSSYFFIKSHGIDGGLIALILGGTLLAIVLWYFFAKEVFLKIRNRVEASKKVKSEVLNF
jgi:O-antigen/teichoic acid export membrane protein